MTTMEERVSRLEGGYEHLATKADVMAVHAEIARLQAAQSNRLIVDIQADSAKPKADTIRLGEDLRSWRNEIRILIPGMGLVVAATNVILKFVG